MVIVFFVVLNLLFTLLSLCCSPMNMTPKTSRKLLSSQSGCDHQQSAACITSYVLNDRLFPVPVHESEDGTYCPVCEGTNTEDGIEEPPRFVR